MEYITTGDRIAVENFEIGSIYKVTFLNETEVYFMCCGIGKDFVMLMSNEPRLFSLTMSSAAEVDAIDDYTPLPPPTPPTNLLQYQTGEPPFTFTTTDTELFSWYIKGPAGEKTANLFKWQLEIGQYSSDGGFILNDKRACVKKELKASIGKGDYIVSMPTGTWHCTILLFNRDGTVADNQYALAWHSLPFAFSISDDDLIFTVTFKYNPEKVLIPSELTPMLNSGSTAKPYEPYGYKIPILCNTTTSIIYIEEALEENDILYSTDTIYKIATELGENLLQVQVETQPSQMQIVYKWEFEG